MATTTEKPKVEKVEPEAVNLGEWAAALEAKLEELEAGLPARIEAAVAAALAPKLEELLKPYVATLEELVKAKTKDAGKGNGEAFAEGLAFAHARIGALHNGVQRAIGVTIPLPEKVDAPAGDVTVTGTEKADRFGG